MRTLTLALCVERELVVVSPNLLSDVLQCVHILTSIVHHSGQLVQTGRQRGAMGEKAACQVSPSAAKSAAAVAANRCRET